MQHESVSLSFNEFNFFLYLSRTEHFQTRTTVLLHKTNRMLKYRGKDLIEIQVYPLFFLNLSYKCIRSRDEINTFIERWYFWRFFLNIKYNSPFFSCSFSFHMTVFICFVFLLLVSNLAVCSLHSF